LRKQELTLGPGFRRMEAHGQAPHAQHRVQAPSRSGISSRRTLHGLAKRHDICRNLIRVWVQKYEAGAFDEDAQAADLLQQYEARIAALERLVGKQALELEFVKGAAKSAPRPKSATTSVVVGPRASASQKDVG
jgi:transposase